MFNLRSLVYRHATINPETEVKDFPNKEVSNPWNKLNIALTNSLIEIAAIISKYRIIVSGGLFVFSVIIIIIIIIKVLVSDKLRSAVILLESSSVYTYAVDVPLRIQWNENSGICPF